MVVVFQGLQATGNTAKPGIQLMKWSCSRNHFDNQLYRHLSNLTFSQCGVASETCTEVKLMAQSTVGGLTLLPVVLQRCSTGTTARIPEEPTGSEALRLQHAAVGKGPCMHHTNAEHLERWNLPAL